MLNDFEKRGEFQENYRYAHDYWGPYVTDAEVYTRAAAGQTWTHAERQELLKEGREPIEFNLIRRPLQFYSGYLRDNLNSIVIAPVEGSDQKTADQLTELSYYTWDKGNGYNIFLDGADEALKSGMSLCGLQMEYSKDFINGELGFFNRTYNSFFLDPTFEKLDLSDCSFAITRDILDKNVIKQLLPFIDPKHIDDIQSSFRDNKFLSYHPNFNTLSRNRNVIAYDQYYKRISKKRKFLVDRDASFFRDITDLSKEEVDKLKFGINRINKLREEAESLEIESRDLPPVLDIQMVDRDFIELNIMLNGEPVFEGEDKTGINQTYPFVPIMCYFEPSLWNPSLRVQGIPATVWSNNRQFNKRHMKIIDMMDSVISTGFKYIIGSVPDVTDLQQTGQNRIIGVDGEHAPNGLNDVQELKGGDANPTLLEYQQVLDNLSLTLANVNESVLGVDEGGNTQVSGKLAQVRIAQGLRSNRKVFDNIEYSHQLLGGLVLKAIQKNYSPAKVKRIIEEEPTPQFYETNFEQYDAVIKQGIRSQSQKDAYYQELVVLKREGIVDVPQTEIIAALQMAGMSDLEEAIKKQQEQQQQSEQLQQVVVQKQIEVLDATKAEKYGLAGERNSRKLSNVGLTVERVSESEQNRAQAALDKARTITEIAGMSEDRILRVLEFVNMLERQEIEDRDTQEAKVATEATNIDPEMDQKAQDAQQQQSTPTEGIQT